MYNNYSMYFIDHLVRHILLDNRNYRRSFYYYSVSKMKSIRLEDSNSFNIISFGCYGRAIGSAPEGASSPTTDWQRIKCNYKLGRQLASSDEYYDNHEPNCFKCCLCDEPDGCLGLCQPCLCFNNGDIRAV
jgi:hypothetical protein